MTAEKFGARLAAIRSERGYSREQLAGSAGVSVESIGAYERGQRTPSLGVAVDIADVLDVSLDVLSGRVGIIDKCHTRSDEDD